MPSPYHHAVGLGRAIGVIGAMRILTARALRRNRSVPVQVRGLKKALELNPIGSDPFVMSQIFGWQEYFPGQKIVQRLRSIARDWIADGVRPIIVDGGANVGYSSLFFANLFPEARVIAIEPDGTSFETLRRNCQGAAAIRPLHGALWKNNDGVVIEERAQGSWSSRVGAARGKDQSVPSFTLRDLLRNEECARVLVLKLDIEGAEREVAAASPDVIRSAMCIMIEPHDFMLPGYACMAPLFRALADTLFDTHVSGENLFFFSSELGLLAEHDTGH
jgi:FkbM family methyltransferase